MNFNLPLEFQGEIFTFSALQKSENFPTKPNSLILNLFHFSTVALFKKNLVTIKLAHVEWLNDISEAFLSRKKLFTVLLFSFQFRTKKENITQETKFVQLSKTSEWCLVWAFF